MNAHSSSHFVSSQKRDSKNTEFQKKKIVFLTGTRADFSKIKSLMKAVQNDPEFELFVFATGMHLHRNFGYTIQEIYKNGFKNVFEFINHDKYYQTELALATTIEGFARYVAEIKPDLIVIHGDRIEPLAVALVGVLNNILVVHIEGGELSGTIDESLRHAISKLAQIHLVNDEVAHRRLLQLGENEDSIFIIGSPDLEILNEAVSLSEAKDYYEINFKSYALVLFHPVTTELTTMKEQSEALVSALLKSGGNFIIIYPNNDLGFELILQSYTSLENHPNFRLFPSLRFEYFITLLRGADFIIGNSSCILKEAVYLGIPGILVGSRQSGRAGTEQVLCVRSNEGEILGAINSIKLGRVVAADSKGCGLEKEDSSGSGKKVSGGTVALKSSELFLKHLKSGAFFKISKQKNFCDRM